MRVRVANEPYLHDRQSSSGLVFLAFLRQIPTRAVNECHSSISALSQLLPVIQLIGTAYELGDSSRQCSHKMIFGMS